MFASSLFYSAISFLFFDFLFFELNIFGARAIKLKNQKNKKRNRLFIYKTETTTKRPPQWPASSGSLSEPLP